MPYIPKAQREIYEGALTILAEQIQAQGSSLEGTAGALNYICTSLALRLLPTKPRYYHLALIQGVFHTMADEFARRILVPYEDEKLAIEGDVYGR